MKLILRFFLFEESSLRIFYCVEFVLKKENEESSAALAQLGERQTEDLKAPCSIHGGGIFFNLEKRHVTDFKFCSSLPKNQLGLKPFFDDSVHPKDPCCTMEK